MAMRDPDPIATALADGIAGLVEAGQGVMNINLFPAAMLRRLARPAMAGKPQALRVMAYFRLMAEAITEAPPGQERRCLTCAACFSGDADSPDGFPAAIVAVTPDAPGEHAALLQALCHRCFATFDADRLHRELGEALSHYTNHDFRPINIQKGGHA